MVDKSRVPVIVGACRYTQREVPDPALSLVDLMRLTARRAAEDTGRGAAVLGEVDTVAVVSGGPPPGDPLYPNMPKTVANALGIRASVHHQRCRGGCGAQATTTLMAQRIADAAPGVGGLVLLTGAMHGNTVRKVIRDATKGRVFRPYEGAPGVDVLGIMRERGWADDPGGRPEFSGTREVFNNAHERRHGLLAPVDAYPLYENRLRYHYGRGVEEHMDRVGEIMSGFTKVAASEFNREYSWYPVERTKAEITTPSKRNRLVGWPYTKYMNAMASVDHAASWLMCSAATAERLGIPQDRWVYVHGGAYANQGDPQTRPTWFVSQWTDYSRIPSMHAALNGAVASAAVDVDQIRHFDFYACFPSVVQMAADSLGLGHRDPRGLTVTGGLPYYGQSGTISSIVAMLETLRRPENRGHYGLVSGNGGLGQKHAAGVYSTAPPRKPFRQAGWAETQGAVDALAPPAFTEAPRGAAEIVTYSVQHARGGGARRGLVIGRTVPGGERFIANTPADPALLAAMQASEWIGRRGAVAPSPSGVNVFTPDGWAPKPRV